MAEVLGIVGTGISIASLTIQILDSIQRVKEFCRQVRDAQKDFEYIVDDLSIINDLLPRVEQIAGSMSTPDRVEPRDTQFEPEDAPNGCLLIRKSVAHCKSAVDCLDKLVSDLHAHLATNRAMARKWHSFRAVQRKREINSIRRDIESAKGTLGLVIAFRSWILHERYQNTANQLFQIITNTQRWTSIQIDAVPSSSVRQQISEEASASPQHLTILERQPKGRKKPWLPWKICRCKCEFELFLLNEELDDGVCRR